MITLLLNPIYFMNLLTMASAKGFDRQERPRTVFVLIFWLVWKFWESNYFTRNDFWEFYITHQKTIDFWEMKRLTFFNKKFIIVSLHNIMRKGCVGVTWLSRPSDLRRVRARSWLMKANRTAHIFETDFRFTNLENYLKTRSDQRIFKLNDFTWISYFFCIDFL